MRDIIFATKKGLRYDKDGDHYAYETASRGEHAGSMDDPKVLRRFYLPPGLNDIIRDFGNDPERQEALRAAVELVLDSYSMIEDIIEWLFTALLLQTVPASTARAILQQLEGTWNMAATITNTTLDNEEENVTCDGIAPTGEDAGKEHIEQTLARLFQPPSGSAP
jgi:hypothetical protein